MKLDFLTNTNTLGEGQDMIHLCNFHPDFLGDTSLKNYTCNWINILICPFGCSLFAKGYWIFFFPPPQVFLGLSFVLQVLESFPQDGEIWSLRFWVLAHFLTSQYISIHYLSVSWVYQGVRVGGVEAQGIYPSLKAWLLIGKIRTKICWYLVRLFSQWTFEAGVVVSPFWREEKRVPEWFLSCQSH